METRPQTSALNADPSWRVQVVRIVEELFPVTSGKAWDLLLDLRSHLLHGNDWNATLDLFLTCRDHLEADHYLPFYRLRRLLSGSLRLEAVQEKNQPHVETLTELLRRKHRTLADLKRAVHREWFEHAVDTATPIQLRVVERG